MQISDMREGDALVVTPAGRLDSTTSQTLETHVAKLGAAGERRLVVDFSGVDYISSAGLRVMLALAKRMRDARGALALCGMGAPVRQVFSLAGFLPLFTVVESREEALRQVLGPLPG